MAAATNMANNSGRITLPLIIVILSVCFGSNFQFYSNSVISNLAEMGQRYTNYSFHYHYGYYVPDAYTMSLLWSFSSAALQLGSLFGAMITRLLADRYGRRRSLIILSLAAATGAVLDGLAKLTVSFELFVLGRVMMGLTLGGGLPLASMFISEIAPIRFRGACGSTQQLFIGLGNLVSYVLTLTQTWGTASGWPLAVALPPLLGAATQFAVLTFYAKDSPRELVLTRNDPAGGLEALRFYQGVGGAEQRLAGIMNETSNSARRPSAFPTEAMVVVANERNKGNGGGKLMTDEFKFMDVFKKRESRHPLLIASLIIFSAQMTGVAAVFAYSKTMFTQAGLDQDTAQYASLGLGACNCFSPLITMLIVERAGRKATIIGGLITADGALIALTVCLFGSNVFHWGPPGAAVGALPCLFVFQIGYAVTNSIVLIAPAELFPQRVRATAMTVVFVLLWFLQTVVVMGYLPFSKLVGVCYSYVPFIACVTLSIALLAVFMPETKGKTVEQVAEMFERRSYYDNSSSSRKNTPNENGTAEQGGGQVLKF